MPEYVNGWLGSVLDSPAKIKLLTFFYHNQHAMDDAHGLSIWVGLDSEGVSLAAEELVQAHVLNKFGDGSHAIFSFNTDDENVKRAVEDYVNAHALPLESHFPTLNDFLQGRNSTHGQN
jgi:hypothetical protein